MFLGIDEQSKRKVKRYNQNPKSSCLIFSLADLELIKVNGNRRKCRLLSDELSNKLRQIYSEGKSSYIPPVKFIDFELNGYSSTLFPNSNCPIIFSYDWWLKLNKKDIQENSELPPNGTLIFNFIAENDFSITCDEKQKEKFCKVRGKETKSARTSALSQIKNTIQNGNIDQTTLKNAGLFLGESYVSARPTDCLHCNSPEELNPDRGREAKYYETHINKCIWRPDRINDFKDRQIDLIQRIINKFNEFKNSVIGEIIKKAQDQGLTKEQLDTTRSGWQNHLLSLKNKKEIENYQTDQLEEDIKNLVETKNKPNEEAQKKAENQAQAEAKKEEERLKKEREEQAKEKKKQEQETKKQAEEQAKQQELDQKKAQVITKITLALNQEPKLNNSDLSSKYQNWENKLNELTELDQITDWESKVLTDIQARRQDKKSAQEIKENLTKLHNPEATPQQKEAALNDLEEKEGEPAYEENKADINQAKQDQATQNPGEYSQNAVNKITQKMQAEGISENDLKDNQTKTLFTSLKNGQIKDPAKIVAAENEIRQGVWQVKVQKEIQTLTSEVNQVLQTSKIKKADITKLKQKLIEFLSKSNVYYSAQHQQAQALLTKLENYSNSNQSNNPTSSSPSSIPWKVIVPILVVVVIVLMAVVIRIKKIAGRKKNK